MQLMDWNVVKLCHKCLFLLLFIVHICSGEVLLLEVVHASCGSWWVWILLCLKVAFELWRLLLLLLLLLIATLVVVSWVVLVWIWRSTLNRVWVAWSVLELGWSLLLHVLLLWLCREVVFNWSGTHLLAVLSLLLLGCLILQIVLLCSLRQRKWLLHWLLLLRNHICLLKWLCLVVQHNHLILIINLWSLYFSFNHWLLLS